MSKLIDVFLLLVAIIFGLSCESLAAIDGLWLGRSEKGLWLVTQDSGETVKVGEGADEKEMPIAKIGFSQKELGWMWSQKIGRVISASSAGGELYLLFDDQSMMRARDSYVLPKMPDGAAAKLLVGQAGGSRLFLIAQLTGKLSPVLSPEQAELATTTTQAIISSWSIFELKNGSWHDLNLTSLTKPILFAGADDLTVLRANGDDSQQADILRFENDVWSKSASVDLPLPFADFSGIIFDGKRWLISATKSEGGKSLVLYELNASTVTQAGMLILEDNPLVVSDTFAFSSSAEEGLSVVWVDQSGDGKALALGRWSQDGKLIDVVEKIGVKVSGEVGPGDLGWWFSILPGILLVMAVMFRGVALPGSVVIPDDMQQAAFWRRGVAFLIDIFPIMTFGSIIFTIFWRDYFLQVGELIQHQNGLEMLASDSKMIWFSLSIYVAFAAYTTITEGIWGYTPGKRIMGLEVRQIKDPTARPGWWPIIIRNVLKIFDLYYTVPICMMFLTRYRQRVGDMMAGTIVLQRKDKQASQTRQPPQDREDQSDRDDLQDR